MSQTPRDLTQRWRFGHASSAGTPARVSVVIPAHNEEHRIEATLVDIASVLPSADIIVVLNGCTDKTHDVVSAVRERYKNIRIIEIEAAVGKGGAIRSGILASSADVVAYVDADGATTGKELERLISLLGDYDAVIGSRWIEGASIYRKQPLLRRILSRGFNALTRVLFGLPFTDTQCGAKVFAGDILRSAMERVETSSLAVDVDILYALHGSGARMREVPTEWSDMQGSKVHPVTSSARMLASLLRLRMRDSFLRYAVPLFDRLFPTGAMSTHSRLQVLICNWRDVKHPQAGGAETYLHEQAKRWVQAGHRVTWLTAGFPGASRNDSIDGVDIVRVGNKATVYALLPLTYIAKLRNRFDIIVDAENGIPFFTPLFSMKRKKLLIFHVHRDVFLKYLPSPLSWLFVWIETWLMPRIYKNVDLITISDDSKSDIERYGLTKRSVEVIRSGVDAQLVPGERSVTPLISYVGRLRTYKRVDWLVEAFAEVRKEIPNCRLAIAGAGDDLARLKALAARLGVAQSCDFLGFVSDDEKRRLLQSSWLFVSPSSMEGWGISVIEANACGTPSIVFDVPGLREAVVNGESGIVLDDRAELAGAIANLLRNDGERARLESGALARAADFSWDKTAAHTLAVLLRDAPRTLHSFVRHDGEWMLISSGSRNRRP